MCTYDLLQLNLLPHVGVTIRQGLDWMLAFTNCLYTPLRTTRNYSAIADLNTL
jgi:hypothetical protein